MGQKTSTTPRCVECRAEIPVPDDYAHGDHIKCGVCGTSHRVHRGEALRLVLADVAPLQDAERSMRGRIERLEDELIGARRSIGLGVNGLFIGIAFLIWQIAYGEQGLSVWTVVKALAIAVFFGVVLELLNYLFLAKRHRILQLTNEIEQLRHDLAEVRMKLRDAMRR
ncbi:MAG: hypothetical protein JXO72_06370 [Vicinamibacteria bacterium]|nr:hypothetical protein [Vicinamibacteria bacterium]